MTTNRHGLTLVELLVAMSLFAVVGGVMYTVLVGTQRLARGQVERIDLQDDVRAGLFVLPAQFREIGYDEVNGPDLLEIAPHHIRFRGMRGVGFTCRLTGTDLYVRMPVSGRRQLPSVGNQLLVFAEDDEQTALDDRWLALDLIGLTTAAACPDGGAAVKLTVHAPPAQVRLGGPVRWFEVLQIGLYKTDGKSWLGLRSWSAGERAYQPLLGPLRDGDGVTFTYYDDADTEVPVTGDRGRIRTIGIELHGRSDGLVWTGASATTSAGIQRVDTFSLKTRVALRNTLRP